MKLHGEAKQTLKRYLEYQNRMIFRDGLSNNWKWVGVTANHHITQRRFRAIHYLIKNKTRQIGNIHKIHYFNFT